MDQGKRGDMEEGLGEWREGKFSQNVMYEERIIKNCWQFYLLPYLNFLEQCLVD